MVFSSLLVTLDILLKTNTSINRHGKIQALR